MSPFGFDIGRTVAMVAAIAVVGYAVLGGLLYIFQSHLIYAPRREIIATPASSGLPFEEVSFASADGTRLSGWWVPSGQAEWTVLFCHGKGGNISYYLPPVEVFNDLGLNVLVFDYRGYGMSGGTPGERGTYLDTEAAWNYLVRERGLDASRIVVCGRSLGGPMAAWLASRRQPAGLLLEATFTSIPELGQELYPLFPIRLLARYDYDTLEYVSRKSCPLLVVHSRGDRLISFEHGRRLYETAAEPKAFLEISGDHAGGFETSEELYSEGVAAFLTELGLPRASE